jgi:hypothetical protein
MPIKPEHLDELLAATSSRKTCLNVLFWSSDRAAFCAYPVSPGQWGPLHFHPGLARHLATRLRDRLDDSREAIGSVTPKCYASAG